MPTQLYEGADLTDVLSRVQADHGPSPTILRSEKIRSGGIGGFFAKERYEVEVSVAEDPSGNALAAPAGAAAEAGPASLMDLVDQVDQDEDAGLGLLGAPAAATPGPAPAPPRTPRFVGQAADPGRAVPAAAAPAASEPEAPAREKFVAPAGSFAAALANVGRQPAPEVETLRPEPFAAGGAVEPAGRARRSYDRPAAPGTGLALRGEPGPEPSVVPAASRLAGLGVPASVLAGLNGDARPSRRALEAVLKDLPRAPRLPKKAGAVLAVAGPADAALDAARALARQMGLPASSVVLVVPGPDAAPGRGVVVGAEAAAKRRAGWKRRKNPVVVAVDAPLTASGAERGRGLLQALEADQVWGAVEATRKPNDVATWARRLGRVDAYALTAVEDSADPASLLALDVPVGMIGDGKAGPQAWAELLAGRLG